VKNVKLANSQKTCYFTSRTEHKRLKEGHNAEMHNSLSAPEGIRRAGATPHRGDGGIHRIVAPNPYRQERVCKRETGGDQCRFGQLARRYPGRLEHHRSRLLQQGAKSGTRPLEEDALREGARLSERLLQGPAQYQGLRRDRAYGTR